MFDDLIFRQDCQICFCKMMLYGHDVALFIAMFPHYHKLVTENICLSTKYKLEDLQIC